VSGDEDICTRNTRAQQGLDTQIMLMTHIGMHVQWFYVVD
jgi:hypothetical protein